MFRGNHAWFLFLVLLVPHQKHAYGVSSPLPSFCSKASISDLVPISRNQCSLDFLHAIHGTEVSEIDSKFLDTPLNFLSENSYTAVLFYAAWCPFSRAFRPVFDSLSKAFPMIRHIAIESSAFWPSVLSQYGVHSFPSLFLYNESVKVKYQGHRRWEHFCQFYREITGLEPIDLAEVVLSGSSTHQTKDIRRWVEENAYLVLSAVFVIYWLLSMLVPRMYVKIRRYWTIKEGYWTIKEATQHIRSSFSREVRHRDTLLRCKGKTPMILENKEKGKGVMCVPGWSSSSLAAVALTESSTSRVGISDNACEIGHMLHKGHQRG